MDNARTCPVCVVAAGAWVAAGGLFCGVGCASSAGGVCGRRAGMPEVCGMPPMGDDAGAVRRPQVSQALPIPSGGRCGPDGGLPA